jgi:hypothetical protein
VDLPPEPTLAPAVVIVVPGQYPVIAAPAPAEPVAPDPVGPDPITDDPDEDDSGSAGVPTPPAPVVALTSLTVQAVTDLAGGRDDCPGCDGITPPDMGAARSNPVEAVRVRLEAVDASGTLTYLGSLTLEPTDAGTAAATADVPIAASYVVSFEGADGGFVLCTGAEPRVTISPTEGGLFATFRLWRGCPVP